MSETLYIQINRNIQVDKREITIGDVAALLCKNAGITARVKTIKLITLPAGMPGAVLYGLLSGMFIGLFAVSLAENIKALPIFVRRVRIGAGLGFVVLAIGLGKAAGHLLYYLKLYP